MGLPRAARRLRPGPSRASGSLPGESRASFWTPPEVRLEPLGVIFGHPESPFGAPVFGLRRLKCFSDNPELRFSSSFPSERSFMKLWKDNLY